MNVKYLSLLALTGILTACAGNPPSYLPTGNKPIVNIEADADERVVVSAGSEKLCVKNKTAHSQALQYKLFWYDQFGVSQVWRDTKNSWQALFLDAKQQREILLSKPTAESQHYRLYLRRLK